MGRLRFTPLHPKSDQHHFSPNNIQTSWRGKVMGIEWLSKEDALIFFFFKFSQLILRKTYGIQAVSPYQAVTSKIYRLKQHFVPPATALSVTMSRGLKIPFFIFTQAVDIILLFLFVSFFKQASLQSLLQSLSLWECFWSHLCVHQLSFWSKFYWPAIYNEI